jgi:hypothetical protein
VVHKDDELEGLVYLTFEDALEIYGAVIGASAVEAVDHLRSRAAQEGALARPASYAHYEQADLALQAAVQAARDRGDAAVHRRQQADSARCDAPCSS